MFASGLSRRARRALALSAAVAAGTAACLSSSPAGAAPLTASIAIKFGTDQPGRPGDANSAVTGPAGVLNTSIWNNFGGASSASPQVVVADIGGTSTAVGTTVSWSSANTWASSGAGEENNTATGENGDLMGGYLDTAGAGGTGVSITVAGIPSVPSFDVYVYMQGGVTGRGGTYAIGASSKEHTGDAAFTGAFLEDTLDPGTTPGSNYIVFHNLTGTGFTLTTTPTIGNPARAPVNAIEIVQTPEPGSLSLLGLAATGLLARRRRNA